MNLPGLNEVSLPKIVQALRDLAGGGTNALAPAVVTLAPGTTETVVLDPHCIEDSLVAPVPLTESAAAARIWLKETRRGGFVWGHDASDAEDRGFRYEVRRP